MSLKLKSAIIILACALAAVCLYTLRGGGLDKRDFPAHVRILAEADSGYHVHAKVAFYPTRDIPILCVPLMGTLGSGSVQRTFNDIRSSGVDVELKKPSQGLCRYRFEILSVACTATDIFPAVHDGSFASVPIGMYRSDAPGSDPGPPGNGLTATSGNRLAGHVLKISGKGKRDHFSGCDSGCGESLDFGLDASDTVLKIVCKEE